MTRLLQGIRVLDLTNVLAGPYCAYQLALLGAEVIKIEEPSAGDLARQLGAEPSLNRRGMGASFLAQNAGKKSVALDLKDPAGRAAFERLVGTADVLVENFRPGVMDRLGLGYSSLRRINPRLVYCAISGFGQDGPLRGNPAYDQIIQGLSGAMSITGDENSAPLRVGFPVSDTLGGLFGAFGIAAALVRRGADGKGAHIDVSMLEATISAMGWAVSNYLVAGLAPRPLGNENMTASPSGLFATGNGWLNIAANKQEQFVSLCREIGRADLATDPRFCDREARTRNRAALKDEIETALATAGAADWEMRLNAADVPAGRVLTLPEVLRHGQVTGRAMVHVLKDVPGVDHPVAVVRGGFLVDGEAPSPALPPPRLGEHGREILGETEDGA